MTERLTSSTNAEWEFTLGRTSYVNLLPGSRFFVSLWLHNRKGFMLIGNGSIEDYPLEACRRSAASLVYLD